MIPIVTFRARPGACCLAGGKTGGGIEDGGVVVKHPEKVQRRYQRVPSMTARVLIATLMAICVVGCRDRVRLPSQERVLEFEHAGPTGPAVDMDRLVRAKIVPGPYRVHSGDVLELTLPVMLYPDLPSLEESAGGDVNHTCRVDDAGTITLPDGRQIPADGKTLGEIETLIVNAYYPGLVKSKPAVYARVLDYRTYRVQVLGAVVTPGVYELRRDQLSLVSLLMEAGGIVETGAATIRIVSARDADDDTETQRGRSLSPSIGLGVGKRDTARQAVEMRCGRSIAPGQTASGIRLQFEPEGTLRTTGWLTISQGDYVLVRQWLDVASVFQRRLILDRVEKRDAGLSRASIEQSLAHLAFSLDESGSSCDVQVLAAGSVSTWKRANTGQFVTFLVGLENTPTRSTTRSGRKVINAVYAGAMSAGGDYDGSDAVSLVLPVRGLNIPFADVPLSEGDAVIVERIVPQYVTVLGLVQTPGNYDYPPDARYNLAQAIGFAGGLNMVADPRYVSVYRPRSDGTVASATFELVNPKNQEELTDRLALLVKPGDVVSVEHTPRTRTNVFIERVFRISLGLYLDPGGLWD